jgi:hypothetical protein
MRLRCRFPGVGQLTQCGETSIKVRRRWKVLLQFQFEDLGTQIQLSNETFCNGVNINGQDGQYEAEDVSLGNVRDGEF